MNASFKIFLLIATVFLASCSSSPSLQKYIVQSKENDAFISVDIPSSILQLKDNTDEEVKKTLESVKKLNFLALELTDGNKKLYESEKEKVKAILKRPKYKQLMRFKRNAANISISYLGKENAVDEVVVFGSDNSKGFALIRILGDHMNPAEIMQITQKIKLDKNSGQLGKIEDLMKSVIN
ncbi:MAG: DUF4252 domain-containing protein [Lutibacter sp.]